MDTILTLDRQIFFAINHLPHPEWADLIAMVFSGAGSYGIIWFLAGALLFVREENRDHTFFLPILLAGAWASVMSSSILKPWVARIRPSDLAATIVVSGTDGYSFPSTHATFSFALAEVMSRYEPRLRFVWYGVAVCIAVSRIYLGVHYPLDVAAGALLGWGIGAVSYRVFVKR